MRNLLLATATALTVSGNSQTIGPGLAFSAPDSVCVNEVFTIQNSSSPAAGSYHWSFCNSTVTAVPQASNLGSVSGLDVPSFMATGQDGSTFYGFITNAGTGSITRFASSAGATGSFTYSNLGSFGGNLDFPRGIQIKKEGSNWYGFVVGGSGSKYLKRLDFGTSLGNVPTLVPVATFTGQTFWDIQIVKTGTLNVGFIIETGQGGLYTLVFGNSLTNTPAAQFHGNIGQLSTPCQLALAHDNTNWHGFIVNHASSTITRLDFGNSLLNAPTATNLGNPAGRLDFPDGIVLRPSCGGARGYISNSGNDSLLAIEISPLTSTPLLTRLGSPGALNVPISLHEIRENDSYHTFVINYGDTSITRLTTSHCQSAPSSTLTSPVLSFSTAGIYTIELLGDEMLDTRTVLCQTIAVSSSPSVITTSSLNLCGPQTVTLSASGASSYTWQPGNLSGSSVVVNPSASTIYTVTGSSNGCSSTAQVSVTVQPPQNISFTASNFSVCNGRSTTLTASGATSYTWHPGGIPGASLVVSPTVTTVYSVIATSTAGCLTSGTITIGISPSPTVTATAATNNGTCAATSTLSANGATSYTWQPGSVVSASLVTTPSTTIIYTVTGESSGCSNSATVAAIHLLNAKISVSNHLDCTNPSAQLHVRSSSGNTVVSWSGPGITSSSVAAQVNINTAGVYTAVVTNTLNNCTSVDTVRINSSIAPLNFSIIPSSTIACFPGPAVNLLIAAPANYTWSPSSSLSGSVGPLVSATPTINTTYTVDAMLGVCTGSSSITISVNPTPTLTTASSHATLCSGTTATLSATGALSYEWLTTSSFNDTLIVTPTTTKQYTVAGFNGPCTSQAVITVSVIPLPALTLSASSSSLCSSASGTLSASGADTYSWSGTGITTSSLLISPTVTTSYSVTGTSSLGCSTSKQLTISIIPEFTVSATATSASLCIGESTTLQATGGPSYTWMPGNTTGSLLTVTPLSTTIYSLLTVNPQCSRTFTLPVVVDNCSQPLFGLALAATTPQGLRGKLYKFGLTLTVHNSSLDTIVVNSLNTSLAMDLSQLRSYTITTAPAVLTTGSGMKINNSFDGNSNTQLILPGAKLKPLATEIITYSLTVEPGAFHGTVHCSVKGEAVNKHGVQLSDLSNNGFRWDDNGDGNPANDNEPTPIVLAPFSFFIPEGFSPNGDGLYDQFEILGLHGRSVDLVIYNRWGNEVYRKSNYDNTWDGTANVNGLFVSGGKLPQGTYYYLLRFTDGSNEQHQGFVMLQY